MAPSFFLSMKLNNFLMSSNEIFNRMWSIAWANSFKLICWEWSVSRKRKQFWKFTNRSFILSDTKASSLSKYFSSSDFCSVFVFIFYPYSSLVPYMPEFIT